MDLSKIKSKLAEQQKKTNGGGKKDNKELFWRPSVGKQVIRMFLLNIIRNYNLCP